MFGSVCLLLMFFNNVFEDDIKPLKRLMVFIGAVSSVSALSKERLLILNKFPEKIIQFFKKTFISSSVKSVRSLIQVQIRATLQIRKRN